MSERLGWGLLAALLLLGLMSQWLFGSFLYDPIWLWLDDRGLHAARLLPFVLVDVIPAMLVLAGILVMTRARLGALNETLNGPKAPAPSREMPPVPESREKDGTPDGIGPDAPIMEAVMYILNGAWPKGETRWGKGQERESRWRDVETGRSFQVLELIREWAKDGKLRVWGKAAPFSPREPIPPQFWRTNRVDGLHTVFEGEENSCTESASQLPMLEKFSALYVSRSQVEVWWRPREAA
ncbi:MAG TPA: hypothetical protein VG798_02440 [Rhizomicrobium sp.]|nr:hypothetical protein [Rhizomicrobium sp.]